MANIDFSAVKAPSRTGGAPRKAISKTMPHVETKTVQELRVEGLMGIAQIAQALCVGSGLMADAATIGMHAPGLVPEIANLADTYEIVAKPIDFLVKVGPFTALIATGLPFILQIAANHKMVNAAALASQGVVDPRTLEAQMRAQVAQVQAAALRAQREAMMEAQKAERELQEMLEGLNGQVVKADAA